MEDKKLVSDFLKYRSNGTFKALYRAKTPRLYQIALRLCANDKHQAEELIQETWMIAIKKLADFQWRSELRTWLTGILINLSRQKRKKTEKEISINQSIQEEAEAISESTFFTTYDLENAINKLPPGFRQVIILHAIEGYKHKEIASLLDISEGTSKSQLFHAKKALRILLQEETQKINKS